MAWIESHSSLGGHPKTKRLARLLQVSLPTAVGILHFLWWWAVEYVKDGDLSDYEVEEIADAVHWDGDPNTVVEALVRAGFLDRTEDGGLLIHDWFDYAGKLIATEEKKRQQNAERQRRYRERNALRNALHNADVTRDSRVTVTQRNAPTIPDQTIPNQINSSSDTHGSQVLHDQGHDADSHAVESLPLPPLPDEDNLTEDAYIAEIERQMVACGLNPNYVVRDSSLTWAKKFYASKVPIDFIRRGIVECFKNPPPGGISSFAYCAKRICDMWARELALRQPVDPIDFSQYEPPYRARDETPGRRVSRDLPEEVRRVYELERLTSSSGG